jgi:hypothetical protein
MAFLLEQVLNLLRGHEIIFNESEVSQMIEISKILHFDLFQKFICKQIPLPQSFDDSIKFIKQSTQFTYQNNLDQAISIVAKQFKNIGFSVLIDLPSSILLQILNSEELVIPNESYLF